MEYDRDGWQLSFLFYLPNEILFRSKSKRKLLPFEVKLNLAQNQFHLAQIRKENCYYDHIPFNL